MAEIWYNPKGGGSAVNFAGCSMKPPILVVDDDPVIRETVSRKLEAAGYEVITAADASEAIAAIGHHSPEVILLDINLPAEPPYGGGPRWDGLQLMSWLRTLRGAQRARFIIITGLLGDQFLYNDPIGGAEAHEIPGYDRVMTADQLQRAMHASDTEYAFSAFALSRN